MKAKIFLLALIVAAMSSCTTAYKTGQTPDDVYFSPARAQDEYVQVRKEDDRRYQSLEDYYDDRFLRMRVANRYRWSALDDYYFNNPYYYNYYSNYSSWNNPWNSYWVWNNYYNPYCGGYGYGGGVIIKNPTAYTPPPAKPVAFNPKSYLGNVQTTVKSNTNAYYNRNTPSGGTRYNNSNSSYNNGNSSYYNSGSSGSKSYSNSSNSSYTPSSSTPSRSYTPSSSGSSSSSSSSSSGSSSSGSTRPPR